MGAPGNIQESATMFTYKNSKGKTYFLHERTTNRGAKLRFFSAEKKDGVVDEKPAGFIVVESRTGLPMLKRVDPVSEAA